MSAMESGGVLNRVTILVPLKDNPQRTRHFLRHCIFPDVTYYFADGSLGGENEALLRQFALPNVTYRRFTPDTTLSRYLSKVESASREVRTPYTMTVDAGDLLLPAGLAETVRALDGDPNASCAGADYYFTREVGPWVTPLRAVESARAISGLSANDALRQMSHEYVQLWYSVFRTPTFQRFWEVISSTEAQHPFMEYIPTLYALSEGPYLHCEQPALVRITHGPRSWTAQPVDMNITGSAQSSLELSRFCDDVGNACGLEPAALLVALSDNFDRVLGDLRPLASGHSTAPRLTWLTSPAVRWPRMRKAVGHYAGYVVNRHGHGPELLGVNWSLDGFRLRSRSSAIARATSRPMDSQRTRGAGRDKGHR